MVDRPDSVYPYSDDGRIAVPSDADWLDPLAVLAFLAATTARIRLATGVLLLPEHNPLIVAKQAATLDVLSRGRFVLGVGIGWSAEEFAALGVPFAGRGARTREYVEAMRSLWRNDPSSYSGELVRFERVRCFPKPVAPVHPGRARRQRRSGARAGGAFWRRLVRLQPDRRRGPGPVGGPPRPRPSATAATRGVVAGRRLPDGRDGLGPAAAGASSAWTRWCSSGPLPRRPATRPPGWRTSPGGGVSQGSLRPRGCPSCSGRVPRTGPDRCSWNSGGVFALYMHPSETRAITEEYFSSLL